MMVIRIAVEACLALALSGGHAHVPASTLQPAPVRIEPEDLQARPGALLMMGAPPHLPLNVDASRLPSFPWDPFVRQAQAFVYSGATAMLLAGCGCCAAGGIGALLALAVGATPQGVNPVLSTVLGAALHVVRISLAVMSILVVAPPTLFLWASSLGGFGLGSVFGLLKSPRALEEDRQKRMKHQEEARRVRQEEDRHRQDMEAGQLEMERQRQRDAQARRDEADARQRVDADQRQHQAQEEERREQERRRQINGSESRKQKRLPARPSPRMRPQ